MIDYRRGGENAAKAFMAYKNSDIGKQLTIRNESPRIASDFVAGWNAALDQIRYLIKRNEMGSARDALLDIKEFSHANCLSQTVPVRTTHNEK